VLPVSTPVILTELESMTTVLEKWIEKVRNGVPGVDVPLSGMSAPGDRLDVWLNELIGELRLVSGKAHNISEILASAILD
jgi:hypothetical protein